MAVTAILLDINIPLSMWVCLVIGTTHGKEDISDTRWVHVRNLPRAVKIVLFPIWAKPSLLPHTNDIVKDYLSASRGGSTAFGVTLSKTTPVLVEVISPEPDSDDGEPPAKASKTTSTGNRTPGRKGITTGGRVGATSGNKKQGEVQSLQPPDNAMMAQLLAGQAALMAQQQERKKDEDTFRAQQDARTTNQEAQNMTQAQLKAEKAADTAQDNEQEAIRLRGELAVLQDAKLRMDVRADLEKEHKVEMEELKSLRELQQQAIGRAEAEKNYKAKSIKKKARAAETAKTAADALALQKAEVKKVGDERITDLKTLLCPHLLPHQQMAGLHGPYLGQQQPNNQHYLQQQQFAYQPSPHQLTYQPPQQVDYQQNQQQLAYQQHPQQLTYQQPQQQIGYQQPHQQINYTQHHQQMSYQPDAYHQQLAQEQQQQMLTLQHQQQQQQWASQQHQASLSQQQPNLQQQPQFPVPTDQDPATGPTSVD